MTNTISAYSLLYNYLQHGWNVTSITSAVMTVRAMLLPAATTTHAMKQRQGKVLYPAYVKKVSEVNDYFTTTTSVNTFKPRRNTSHRHHQQHHNIYGLYPSVTPRYRAPRAPIVLCHGLYGFDRMGPEKLPLLQVHYWNGIEKALCDLGAKVIVTRVPKTETISNRAYVLHSILSSFMANNEINFIGHSMGGLDCRYLLSHIRDRSYRVSSLSTICTPHRGSPVMDFFRDTMGLGRQQQVSSTGPSSTLNTPLTVTPSCVVGDISKNWPRRGASSSTKTYSENTTLPSSNQLHPWISSFSQWFDAPAYNNLTTEYCTQHFNPTTPDDSSVAYYSYTAKSAPAYWSSLLGASGQLIQKVEGDNDGVVSVSSGKWGQHVKTVDDVDHWDFTGKSMIPYRTKANSQFDRIDFYVELANHLYKQGH